MNILLWIIFGGLAGWIASLIVGEGGDLGLLGNIVVGIVGAFVGGWIADAMGRGGEEGPAAPTSLMGFVWAVLGAIVLLLVINLIF